MNAHVPVVMTQDFLRKRSFLASVILHLMIGVALWTQWPALRTNLPEPRVIKATLVKMSVPTARLNPPPVLPPQTETKPPPPIPKVESVKPPPVITESAKPPMVETKIETKAPAPKVDDSAERLRVESARIAEMARNEEALNALAAEISAEESRSQATNSGLLDEYRSRIRQKVQRYWVRPASAGKDLVCEVNVTQMPGGDVLSAGVGRCNGDDVVRQSIERAVLKASPLPEPPDPSLFERNLIFIFKPE